MTKPSKVFIVDDHDIVRFGLGLMIDGHAQMQVIGASSSLQTALLGIHQQQPDLVISDLGLSDSKGLDTVRAVVAAQQGRPTLFVSMHEEGIYAEQAILLGARGFLMKDCAIEHVVAAALMILGGDIWLSPRINTRLIARASSIGQRRSDASEETPLSSREMQVLEQLGSGKTTKQIAFDLGISPRTIDIHRARLKQKLGVHSSSELIAYAVAHLG